MPEVPERPQPSSWLLVPCYLAFLGFLPLLLAKGDREVRWHARNGLLLFGGVAAAGAVATVIGILVPALSCLYAVVMLLLAVAYSVVVVLAIVQALEGKRLIVPGISRYAERA
jgi:uncharacterized membrane protein